MRRFCLLLCTALIPTFAVAQSSVMDSQNLRALLDEVRQLRRDLQTTTVAAQRVQIVLYRLQLQDAAVDRATRAMEEAHTKLATVIEARTRAATQIQDLEERQGRTQNLNLQERKDIEEAIPQLKRRTEQLAVDEEQARARASEAEGQLKVEQLKLDALHKLLDQLDQTLDNVGRKAANPAQ